MMQLWTEHMDAQLIRLWQRGLSTEEIGKRMVPRVSKNAVIGRARRLRNRVGDGVIKPRPSPIVGRNTRIERVESKRKGVPEIDECHFLGNAGYCRKPVKPGRAYCPECCEKVYVKKGV